MKKLLVILAALLTVGVPAQAQLSRAKVTTSTLNVGNRPDQGSFGLYVGATTEMFGDLFDGDTEFKSLPLVNLKYMTSDNFEIRVGLQFYKKGESAKATTTVGTIADVDDYQYLETKNRIYPGIAYHFDTHNLLDVYCGAELLLGWERNKNQVLDDKGYVTSGSGSLTAFQFGGGAFVGLQAFIADLPIALGVEYGFHGYGNYNQKYKRATADGDWYSVNSSEFQYIGGLSGKEVSASKVQFGQQIRFTLSYYFN